MSIISIGQVGEIFTVKSDPVGVGHASYVSTAIESSSRHGFHEDQAINTQIVILAS